jgi:hypothetical protein
MAMTSSSSPRNDGGAFAAPILKLGMAIAVTRPRLSTDPWRKTMILRPKKRDSFWTLAVEPPSPEEIRRRSARIRAGWSEAERRSRAVFQAQHVEIAVIPEQALRAPSQSAI